MSINARGPINQQESAYNEAMSLLRKDDIFSERKKRVITIFESGEGSIQSRDRITEIIANLDINGTTINNLADIDNSFKARLTSFGSVEEKIAYIISLNFIKLPATQSGIIPQFNATNVKNRMETYLNIIEEESDKWTNYSQKFIIRHAALNRFNPDLKAEELEKLDGIIGNLKDIISKEKLNYSFHLGQETDAQKIMKVSELIRIIRCANITPERRKILNEISKNFDELKLRSKLDPLDNLDKAYSNLSAALNNLYTNNRASLHVRGKSSMILRADDIRRLQLALGVLKNDSNLNIDNYVNLLLENGTIDINATLEEILTGKELKDALKKSNLTEEHFIRLFLEHISQELVILAKHKLDLQKKKVFKNNTKDFENDINIQRESQRRKIINIGQSIRQGNTIGNDDISLLTSYLRSNKHVFRLGENPTNDPIIANNNANIQTALDTAICHICPRTDILDRTHLRNTILEQNQHVNELFYGDNNPFKRKDALRNYWGHSELNHLRRISEYTSVLSKKYGQSAAKVVLGGAAIAAVASVGAGTILTGLAVAAGLKLGAKGMNVGGAKYHAWINKERKGWRNFMFMPLKAAKLVTVPLEKLGYGIDVGSNSVVKQVGKTRTKINELVAGNIKKQKWAQELTNDEVNNLFSLIALGLNGAVRLTAEGTSLLTRTGLDMMDTHEKRRILEGIYATENAQNLREFAEQVEIQSLIQEDVGLFNKDGYVENIETNGENSEKKEESPEVPKEAKTTPEKPQEKNGKTKIQELLKSSNIKIAELIDAIKESMKKFDKKSEIYKCKNYMKAVLVKINNLLNAEQIDYSELKKVVIASINELVGSDSIKNATEKSKYGKLLSKRELILDNKKQVLDKMEKGEIRDSVLKDLENKLKDVDDTMKYIKNTIGEDGYLGKLKKIIDSEDFGELLKEK